MVHQEASRLAVDGVHGEVAGTGPPVVLSHDGLLDSGSWDAQFGALAAGHRVARWDRRGYGRSPRPTAPFSSVEDLAAVVRAVVVLPGSGHVPHLEVPEAFNRMLLGFLAEVPR
jgi:pimeloyl-ACP methyl ester carboxylesterase